MAWSQFVGQEDKLETLRTAFRSDSAGCSASMAGGSWKRALSSERRRPTSTMPSTGTIEETPDVQFADFAAAASETFPLLDDIERDGEGILRVLGRQDAVVVLLWSCRRSSGARRVRREPLLESHDKRGTVRFLVLC